MVNTTTSKRAIFSKIRALSIQAYLGHNAFMQTCAYFRASTNDDHPWTSKDVWEEAQRCSDLGRRAHAQKMELMKELFPLLTHTKNAKYYYGELDALREKYHPSHWMSRRYNECLTKGMPYKDEARIYEIVDGETIE